MGDQLRAPLKPLEPSQHYCIEGLKGGALLGSIMPRDGRLPRLIAVVFAARPWQGLMGWQGSLSCQIYREVITKLNVKLSGIYHETNHVICDL